MEDDDQLARVGVLHDLGNALTTVVGWLDLAMVGEGEERERAIRVALSHAKRTHRTLRLAMSGATSAPRHLRSILGELCEGLDVMARGKRVTLRTRFDESLEAAWALQGDCLHQVVENLVINAIHFTEPDGFVEIALEAGQLGMVMVSVIDRGPGVSDETRAHLFHKPITSRIGGVGVGLLHARGIAERAGGRLSLVPSNEGAHFLLVWPTSEAPEAPPPSSVPRRAIAPSMLERLIVLEDDPVIVGLLETGFRKRGASLTSAANIRDFERALDTNSYTVALCDLSPLGTDPVGKLGRLRVRHPGVRFVVMSGDPELVESPAMPFDALVPKPFELEELFDALETITPA